MEIELAALVRKIAIFTLPVLFAITLHEAAHGYVARYFGDFTAAAAGRISLNPLRHIDPVGTILLPLATLLLANFLFGWAKPVPVNFNALRHPKQDMLWVAAAGPAANLFMALFWALVIKLAPMLGSEFIAQPLVLMGAAGIVVNVILMVLNLLPLPPLDGGRIAISLLPHRLAYGLARFEPYGFIVLIALLVTGVLGTILWPMIGMSMGMIAGVAGVSLEQVRALLAVI